MFARNVTASILLAAAVAAGPVLAADQNLTPSMIKTMIDYKLLEQKIGKGDSVRVTVDGSNVTLDGEVESVSQVRRAEKIAYGVSGVSSVRNNLKVDLRGDMPDQKIADAVASEIRGSVWFDIFDWVEGTVQDGKLVLQGYVREPWRRSEYGQLAERVRGVTGVDNRIKQLPLSTFDDQLRLAVAQGIYGHPQFTRYANRSLPPIHIVVDNGKVILKGAVNSELEKQLAGTIANQTQAFAVENGLTVDARQARN